MNDYPTSDEAIRMWCLDYVRPGMYESNKDVVNKANELYNFICPPRKEEEPKTLKIPRFGLVTKEQAIDFIQCMLEYCTLYDQTYSLRQLNKSLDEEALAELRSQLFTIQDYMLDRCRPLMRSADELRNRASLDKSRKWLSERTSNPPCRSNPNEVLLSHD